MFKTCVCGEPMEIGLRTVIYSRRVEIVHVPVFACGACSRSEVAQAAKPEITKLIAELGRDPGRRQIRFEERSELAYLIHQAADRNRSHADLQGIIDERINHLLDLLLLAQSLEDAEWVAETRGKLKQITALFASADSPTA